MRAWATSRSNALSTRGFRCEGGTWWLSASTATGGVRVGEAAHARALVDSAIAAVRAESYAGVPVGLLSGGEHQRIRVAQAIVSDPALLLCDEPLLSLDLNYQRTVVDLLDARRRERETAVIFVTHEINPILPFVDRVLYIASTSWAVGSADEVLTSETLSRLYGTAVDVLRVRGRIVVVGAPDEPDAALGESGHAHGSHREERP